MSPPGAATIGLMALVRGKLTLVFVYGRCPYKVGHLQAVQPTLVGTNVVPVHALDTTKWFT